MEIVEMFSENLNTKVLCPYCQNGFLAIKDIPFDINDVYAGGERFIGCNLCRKYEIVLYRTPPKNWYKSKEDE